MCINKGGLCLSQIVLGIYGIAACIMAYIVIKTNKKNSIFSEEIGRVMLSVFFMIIFYSMNLMCNNRLLMKVGISFSILLLDFVALFFLQYIVKFVEYEERFPSLVYTVMYLLVLVDGLFQLMSPFNYTTLDYMEVTFNGRIVLTYLPKLPFSLHYILIILITLLSIIILTKKNAETPKIYWRRYYFVWLTLFSALLFKYIFFKIRLIVGIDLSILCYAVLGGLLYYNTFYYQEIVNKAITRGMIFDYLNTPVILFDYEGYVADFTEHMTELVPRGLLRKNQSKRLTSTDIVELLEIKEMGSLRENHSFECCLFVKGEKRLYQCEYSCMKQKDKFIGSSFEFHDITSAKEAYFALERSILYDKLTGFFNKKTFYYQFPQWEDERYWPITVAVFNINNLKLINDTNGTEYGDQVVLALADVLRKRVGSKNFITKIDDDLAVVFENIKQDQGILICEKIRADFESIRPENPITLEYGIAEMDHEGENVGKVFNKARNSMVKKKMLRTASASSALVGSLKQTLSESDYETEEHVERTRTMAERLGRAMELSDSEIAKLELLAVLHDIGKVAIPHSVLLKKGKLTEEERKIMQEHTVKGYRIAKTSPELGEIADCILSHHEKWDGTGYPNGLKGEEIPLLSRIISAVDSHDVMVHNRPYHIAMPEKDAIVELRRCAGTQFDPHVIEVFARLLEEEELNKASNSIAK